MRQTMSNSAFVTGCSGTQSFTISEMIEVNGTGAATNSVAVNLKDIAGDAWKYRNKVKDANITSATAVIRQVHGDNTATSVAGSASLAGGGQSAVFVSGNANVAVGTVQQGQNLDTTGGIIKSALKNDGALSVSYTATPTPAGAKTHITVEVLIDVEVEWSAF